MDLPRANAQLETAQDLFLTGADVKVSDLEIGHVQLSLGL